MAGCGGTVEVAVEVRVRSATLVAQEGEDEIIGGPELQVPVRSEAQGLPPRTPLNSLATTSTILNPPRIHFCHRFPNSAQAHYHRSTDAVAFTGSRHQSGQQDNGLVVMTCEEGLGNCTASKA